MPTRETLCDRVRPNSFARNTLASGRDSPLLLQWSSDDHRCDAAALTSLHLFRESTSQTGILGDQIAALKLSKHGFVDLCRKWPLHTDEMLSFDPQLRTGADHGRDGQHPGKKPLLVIRVTVNLDSSLLPVVRKMFPSVPERSSAAFSVLST